MAAIQKRPTGFQAQFRRAGYQAIFKALPTAHDAEAWLRTIHSKIDQGAYGVNCQAEETTLLAALERYESEVNPTKKGANIERRRIRKWKLEPTANRGLSLIRSRDIKGKIV